MQSAIASSVNANPQQSVGEVDIVVLGEGTVSYDNPVGNFIIPGLTPSLNQGLSSSASTPKRNPKNIINSDDQNFGLAPITKSNFLQIVVPKYMFTILEVKVTGNEDSHKAEIIRQTYSQGQKFMVIYKGQNRQDPVIVGVV